MKFQILTQPADIFVAMVSEYQNSYNRSWYSFANEGVVSDNSLKYFNYNSLRNFGQNIGTYY